MRRVIIATLVVIVIAAALVGGELLSGNSSQKLRAAPALPTSVLVPPRLTLAELRGKPAVIHFWASWCGPCHKEAPEIERFARSLHGRANLVGIDLSDGLEVKS
jgi:thiol-disulfide isomerase/thioredoxin